MNIKELTKYAKDNNLTFIVGDALTMNLKPSQLKDNLGEIIVNIIYKDTDTNKEYQLFTDTNHYYRKIFKRIFRTGGSFSATPMERISQLNDSIDYLIDRMEYSPSLLSTLRNMGIENIAFPDNEDYSFSDIAKEILEIEHYKQQKNFFVFTGLLGTDIFNDFSLDEKCNYTIKDLIDAMNDEDIELEDIIYYS